MKKVNIDDIMISEEAYARYRDFAHSVGKQMAEISREENISLELLEELTDEEAELLDGGALSLYVVFRGRAYGIVLQPNEWWMKDLN